jgi:hypothetical protein
MREHETRIEWAADVEWDEDVAGLRPCDVVELDEDGEEVSHTRTLATYGPSRAGDATSPETQADLDEVAIRRSEALGRPVAVAGFVSSGRAMVLDYEGPAELCEGELVPVASVAVEPSPGPGETTSD